MVECSCPGNSDFMCQYSLGCTGSVYVLTMEDCTYSIQYNLPHFPYGHIKHTYYYVEICFWLQPFVGGYIYVNSPS